jgi:hypothetical protein
MPRDGADERDDAAAADGRRRATPRRNKTQPTHHVSPGTVPVSPCAVFAS